MRRLALLLSAARGLAQAGAMLAILAALGCETTAPSGRSWRDVWTAGLRSNDPRVRAHSLELMSVAFEARDESLALHSLDDPDARVRGAALSALSRIGTPRAHAAVLRACQDEDPSACATALFALRTLGSSADRDEI